MAWVAVGGAAVGAIGAYASSKNNKKAAEASAAGGQLDPRVNEMLFGNGGTNQGLLSQYQGMLDTPRSDAANNYANANANYLTNNGGADMDASRYAAYRAMGGNSAPMSTAAQAGGAQAFGAQSAGASASLPAYAQGVNVQAPGQNNVNVSGSYDSLINGQAGNSPYLTGAIQKGINQSSSAFGNMLTDAKSATQDLLGNVRGGAIAAGQYGGSRQALAEGKAIDSFNTNVSRAASQFGQNNTDAAVSAQAGAYDADRNRQLSATQGLSGQQYSVAQQNAANSQAAQMQNVQNSLDVSKTNAGLAQNNQQFNAGLGQSNNQFNAGLQQQTGQFNAGLQQQTGLANQQSQLSTNAQNNSSNLAGAGLLSGLLGQAGSNVNANDNYSLTRAQGVNSLLQPYLSQMPTQQPMYQNTAGNVLGGGLAGLQLGSSLGGLFGGGNSTQFQGEKMGSLGSLFGDTGWGSSNSYF